MNQYKDTFSNELITVEQDSNENWSVTYPSPAPGFKTIIVNVSKKTFKEYFYKVNE